MTQFDASNEAHVAVFGRMVSETAPSYWWALPLAAVGAALGVAYTDEIGAAIAGGFLSGVAGLLVIHFTKRSRALAVFESKALSGSEI